MSATGLNKLLFGNLPRLLLAWVSTEAVRTQSRELVLGHLLSEFMRELGIYNSGGWEQTKLRNQMRRLFGCTVQLTYKDANVERFVNSPIAESGEYWWNPQRPDQPSLWDSKIELSEKFFNEIIRHPVYTILFGADYIFTVDVIMKNNQKHTLHLSSLAEDSFRPCHEFHYLV